MKDLVNFKDFTQNSRDSIKNHINYFFKYYYYENLDAINLNYVNLNYLNEVYFTY